MPQCYLDAVRQIDQTVNPLFCFLKARLTLADHGKASIVMPVGPHLRQGGGNVAGGILATMADECMAHAVMSLLEPGQSIVTAEMNIRYLRSTNPEHGGELIAWADVIKSGHKLAVATATVHDSAGQLLATAGATFYIHSAPGSKEKKLP